MRIARIISKKDMQELLDKLGVTADFENQNVSNIQIDEEKMTLGTTRYMIENVDAIKEQLESNNLYQIINEKCTALCDQTIMEKVGNEKYQGYSKKVQELQKELQSDLLLGLINETGEKEYRK
jgi:hypothetical protein